MNISIHMRYFVPCIGLGLLLVAGCSNDSGKGPQAMAPEVSVVQLRPSHIVLTTELVGRTVSFLQAEVRPQVRGIIRQREFVEGGEVSQGQILYQIEPESYQAVYDNAQAALAKAEANQEVTRLRARRVSELRKTNAVSQQDNDDAQAAYLQAQAEVASAKAALEAASIDMNRTRIAAPISGRISKSSVTVGALVTSDQAMPLATIYQMDPMYVDVTQSAEELMFLQRALTAQRAKNTNDTSETKGVSVKLVFSDGREYPHTGKMQFADVGVNEATGTVTMRAEFPNPDKELLPGLYVRAVLIEGETDQAILVPQRSTLRDNRGNPQVLVVTDKGTAERRTITVGKNYGENWIVLDGIKAGETVIIEGIQKVRPGSPVRPVPYEPTTPAAQKAAATQPGS